MRSHGNGHHSPIEETLAMLAMNSPVLQNRVFAAADASGPHTPNTGSQLNLIALVVAAKVSGPFLVGFDLPFTGGTPPDTYDYQINVDSSAVTPTFSGATGAGATVANGNPGGPQSVQIASGVGGIVVTSAVVATTLFYDSGTQVMGTVAPTGKLSYVGMVYGVPSGDTAIIRLSVNLSGGALTIGCSSAYAIEMP